MRGGNKAERAWNAVGIGGILPFTVKRYLKNYFEDVKSKFWWGWENIVKRSRGIITLFQWPGKGKRMHYVAGITKASGKKIKFYSSFLDDYKNNFISISEYMRLLKKEGCKRKYIISIGKRKKRKRLLSLKLWSFYIIREGRYQLNSMRGLKSYDPFDICSSASRCNIRMDCLKAHIIRLAVVCCNYTKPKEIRMRKRILFCIVSCLIICCIGCQNNDFGGRPTDYGPALWISEEPYIWFEVQEEVEYTRGNNPIVKGELTIDDEVYPCRVTFKPAGGICFYMESDWDEKTK